MVKRYDRRSLTSAENGRRAWGLNLEAQVAELEEKIRALADTTDDGRLRFEALRYLIDRRAGKPFVAVNPADRKAARTDNHIQIAAQTLILGPPSAPAELEVASREARLPEPKECESGRSAVRPNCGSHTRY